MEIRCIKDVIMRSTSERAFTVDKVYELFDNSWAIDDQGDIHGIKGDNCNSFFREHFIFVVKKDLKSEIEELEKTLAEKKEQLKGMSKMYSDDRIYGKGFYFDGKNPAIWYTTKENKEKAEKRIYLTELMRKEAEKAWGDEKIDWDSDTQKKIYTWIDCVDKRISSDFYYEIKFTQPIFPDNDSLFVAIKKHRKLFDEVWGTEGYEIG